MGPTELEALLDGAFPSSTVLPLNGRRGPWLLRQEGATDIALAVDSRWASLQRLAPAAVGPSAIDLLALQSGWPGGVKWVASRPLPMLRADVPLLSDTAAGRHWVVRQLRAALAGLQAAAAPGATPQPSSPESDEGSVEPEVLACTCKAGGWGVVVEADGTVRIDLQVRGVPRSVGLRSCRGGIRASVALAAATLAHAGEPGRAAAGALLLRASAALRWARAFARGDDGPHTGAGFECFVAAPHDEQALLLAVDALIAACEMFGREAEALVEHRDIASLYLQCLPGIAHDLEDESSFTTGAVPVQTASTPAAHAALG